MTKNTGPTDRRDHTFVVYGRLEQLIWDAAIIPTDREFTVEQHWHPITGLDIETMRTTAWGATGFGLGTRESKLGRPA